MNGEGESDEDELQRALRLGDVMIEEYLAGQAKKQSIEAFDVTVISHGRIEKMKRWQRMRDMLAERDAVELQSYLPKFEELYARAKENPTETNVREMAEMRRMLGRIPGERASLQTMALDLLADAADLWLEAGAEDGESVAVSAHKVLQALHYAAACEDNEALSKLELAARKILHDVVPRRRTAPRAHTARRFVNFLEQHLGLFRLERQEPELRSVLLRLLAEGAEYFLLHEGVYDGLVGASKDTQPNRTARIYDEFAKLWPSGQLRKNVARPDAQGRLFAAAALRGWGGLTSKEVHDRLKHVD